MNRFLVNCQAVTSLDLLHAETNDIQWERQTISITKGQRPHKI